MSRVARRFANAIRRVGGEAALTHPEGGLRESFPASIQPEYTGGEEAFAAGIGAVQRYRLYAPCGTAADRLRPGDVVEFRGVRYSVRQIETPCFSGRPAYHRAALCAVPGAT